MKYALVTGATGGIGLATSKELITQGYEVIGLDKNPIDNFEHFNFVKTDITSEESVIKAFEQVNSLTSKIDVIINLAGMYDLNSLVEMSEKDFTRIFDVNVFGVYRVNKVFLPLLDKKSKIIITTSELGPLDPLPFTGIYGITKATLEKYAYSLRMELQLLDIQVVVVRPGAIDTGLLNVSMDRLNSFAKTTTHYEYNATKFVDIVNKVESKKIPPEKLAKLMVKIVNMKNPKYVYKINRNPLLRILNALPRKMQNKIIKRILEKK